MSIDPSLERSVLAEFALRELRERRRRGSDRARWLAERLHRGRHDLLAHPRGVAYAVLRGFRAVAWLHHASEASVTPRELAAAGLTKEELTAVELLASPDPPPARGSVLERALALGSAPSAAGYLARVVARAAIEARLDGARPDGETLTALRLLPDPDSAR